MRSRVLTALVCLAVSVFGITAWGADEPAGKPLRAGIIGLTTSHVIAFTGVINDPKATGALADVEVTAAFTGGMPDNSSSWGRREQYTEQLKAKGVKIYDTIEEMVENVDAVLVESVDGRPHLEQARPVIAAGKPLFIDKPLAGSLAECVEIFELAKEAGVPVFSSSSLRYGSGIQAVRQGTAPFGEVKECVAWSSMSIEPHHPDLYWYGIHGCEILFTIMGTGCETVQRVEQGKVVGTWKDGRKGVFEARKGYGAEVTGSKESGNAGGYEGYKPLVVEICEFFKTGKAPVSMEETLEIYAFMEAADESKRQGGKPVKLAEVLEKARKSPGPREKKIFVLADGTIVLDGSTLEPEQVTKRLKSIKGLGRPVALELSAARDARSVRVEEVLDACTEAGLSKVHASMLPTTPEK